MKYEVYSDESCIEALSDSSAHKYIGIGSIWLQASERAVLKRDIAKIKRDYSFNGELKWKKVSPSSYNFYKRILDYFFNADYLRARVIVIESSKVNNYKFHESDAELSFYKFYYQLIKHWIFDFNEYSIFLDYKVNRDKSRLKTLKRVLNYSNLTSVINNVQALPSEQSAGIQLADVVTGLVTAKFNSKNTSKAKLGLIEHIETNYLSKNISQTSKAEEKFNIFKINLNGGW